MPVGHFSIVSSPVFGPSQRHAPFDPFTTLRSSMRGTARLGTSMLQWAAASMNTRTMFAFGAHVEIGGGGGGCITIDQNRIEFPLLTPQSRLLSTWQLWNGVAMASFSFFTPPPPTPPFFSFSWGLTDHLYRWHHSDCSFVRILHPAPSYWVESSSDAATVENLIWETEAPRKSFILGDDGWARFQMHGSRTFRAPRAPPVDGVLEANCLLHLSN